MLPPTSRSRKRKIPGPIGLLDSKPNLAASSSGTYDCQNSAHQEVTDLAGSQGENDPVHWQSEVWLSAWSTLGLATIQAHAPPEAHEQAMRDGHIDTPLRLLSARSWDRERSGVCLVVIESVQHHSDKDATVNLVDPTGSAAAYIHCKVLEDSGPEFTAGAVLLLRAPAVVHNRGEAGGLFLNVTPNNVAMLWPSSTRFTPRQQQHERLLETSSFAKNSSRAACLVDVGANKAADDVDFDFEKDPESQLQESQPGASSLGGGGEQRGGNSATLPPHRNPEDPSMADPRISSVGGAGMPKAPEAESALRRIAGLTNLPQTENEDWMWDLVSKEDDTEALSRNSQINTVPSESEVPSQVASISELNARPSPAPRIGDAEAGKRDEDDDLLDDLLND